MTTRIAILLAVMTIAGCSREAGNAPSVLGIPFAAPTTSIKNYLPKGAKPEQYPTIQLYGYKLLYPNPENWEVLVQEDAPDELADKAIFMIYTSRTIDADCNRKDTKALVEAINKKYGPDFSSSYVNEQPNEHGYIFIAASERRMLTAGVHCLGRRLGASFTYIDLDRYRYKKPEEMAKLIAKEQEEAKAYASRSFKP